MAKEIKVALVLDTKNFDKGIKSASASMGNFKSKGVMATGAMAGLAARLVPLAAGLLAVKKGFDQIGASLGVSSQFEDVQITLSNIIGSAEGGAAALNLINEAAQKLPFAFEDLAGAAPALATVSGNIGELEDNMMLAADIAGNFGIPFDQAASTLQRAFSAGAGAADVFREKGVLAAAGFEAGVTYSVDETIAKLREFGGEIEGAAQKLNTSFTGAVSQSGDRLTLFQKAMGDAFRPEMTAMLNSLVETFDKNKEAILEFATAVGTNALNGMIAFARGIATVIDLGLSVGQTLTAMGRGIKRNFGDQIKAVADVVVKAFGLIVEGVSLVGKGIGKVIEITTGVDSVTNFFDAMLDGANKLRTEGLDAIEDVQEGLGTFIPVTTARDAVNQLVDDFTAGGQEIRAEITRVDNAAKDLGRDLGINLGNGAVSVSQALAIATASAEDLATSLVTLLGVDLNGGKYNFSVENTSQAFQDALKEGGNLVIALGTIQTAFGRQIPTLEEYNQTVKFLTDNFEDLNLTAPQLAQILAELNEQFIADEPIRNFIDSLETASSTLSEDLAQAFMDGESAGDSFQKFFKTMVKQIIADIIRLSIIQPILGAIMAPFGFGFGAGGNIIKIPGKANGGAVMANRPYIVGERGPELFVPSSQGSIVPNGQMGGGQVVYNINAVDSQSFEQALARDPSFVFAVTEAGRRKLPGRV